MTRPLLTNRPSGELENGEAGKKDEYNQVKLGLKKI
jgi:hypothetical protein